MCTTYVFQDPKTGDHLEVRESWGPLGPSDTVPDGRTPYIGLGAIPLVAVRLRRSAMCSPQLPCCRARFPARAYKRARFRQGAGPVASYRASDGQTATTGRAVARPCNTSSGGKRVLSKITRTLIALPAPVLHRARRTRCGGSPVRTARRQHALQTEQQQMTSGSVAQRVRHWMWSRQPDPDPCSHATRTATAKGGALVTSNHSRVRRKRCKVDKGLGARLMAGLSELLVAILAGVAADQLSAAINRRRKRKEEEDAETPKGKHFSKR